MVIVAGANCAKRRNIFQHRNLKRLLGLVNCGSTLGAVAKDYALPTALARARFSSNIHVGERSGIQRRHSRCSWAVGRGTASCGRALRGQVEANEKMRPWPREIEPRMNYAGGNWRQAERILGLAGLP